MPKLKPGVFRNKKYIGGQVLCHESGNDVCVTIGGVVVAVGYIEFKVSRRLVNRGTEQVENWKPQDAGSSAWILRHELKLTDEGDGAVAFSSPHGKGRVLPAGHKDLLPRPAG